MMSTSTAATDAGQRLVVEIPPHTVPHADAGAAGLLPRTGGAIALWVILLAVGLVVIGTALVVAGRRAQRPASTAAAKASGASTIG